ncbi:MAG TPA: hypothetical protein PLV13_02645 [Ilumatobacteraceae bacterium]|nr:hypothetical protein [Ilumatobacteraceae bacterium]
MAPRPTPPSRNTATMVTSVLVVIVALVGIVFVLAGNKDDGGGFSSQVTTGPSIDPMTLTAGQVLLEPINQPSFDPFTDDMRVGAETQPTVTLPDLPSTTVATTLPDQPPPPAQVQGATPGLYGGTRNNAVCDKQSMITFLEANPEKGAAWAQVQGIAVADLRAFIEALTPVTLTKDTLVTNHGFRNGQPYAHPSVLQAGTAVLVDQWGVPRAKCSCGNPLLPPPVITAPPDYVGPQWPTFDPTVIIVVVASPTPIVGGVTIVDTSTGDLIVRPIGSDIDTPDLATGDVRVTLTWGDTADLDLAVQDPNGEEINYDQRSSSSGGQLDVDANSGCTAAVTSPAENVIWGTDAPTGQYVVQVSLYNDCASPGDHPFHLQVLVGGIEVPLFVGGDDGSLTPTDGAGALSAGLPTVYFVFNKG